MEAPPLERKLAAILAADVEGYSRMMHADEERTLAILTERRALVDNLIETANGKIFGSAGDSVLAEFPSVVLAFNCAVAIQQASRQANADLPENERMHLRIGINVGDVMVKDEDIFGDGVNIAARLEALAEAGGICVTRGVRDHLRDRAEADFEDLGEQVVKNIARPVRVFRARFDVDAEPVLPAAASASTQQPGATPQAGAETASTNGDPSVEVSFWETVRDSGNPAMIEAYLDKYPGGEFSTLAHIILDQLGEETRGPT